MGFTIPNWIVGNLLSFGAQLPYVTLPLLILVAFSCPPFRGRGVLFAALIVVNDYACTVSPWPPNTGDTRPMRYGMAGSWLFVLPALERLVLHVPEHDFWLLDHQGLANNGVPGEMTWAKICWAAKLVTTPRAVGWNIGHRGVNDARARIRGQGITRAKFATSKLARAVMAYVTLDTVIFAAKHTEIPTTWAWDLDTLKRIAYLETLMALSVYSTMSLQFELAAMVSVVFVRGKPEDWPPLFGNLSDCYTISNVWGRFWHGYVRQPVLGGSRAIVNALHLSRRSPHAYFIHLITAFLLSCCFHILSLFVICEGYLDPQRLMMNMSLFFMAQPLGTMMEYAVINLWERSTLCEYLVGVANDNLRGFAPPRALTSILHVELRALGYIWVCCWFVGTGYWFIQVYAAIGVLEWPLPVSIWR